MKQVVKTAVSLPLLGLALGSFPGANAQTPTAQEVAKLIAGDRASAAFFGSSVALDGDTAVVGALGDDENGLLSGAAYVFGRDVTGTWAQQAKLVAGDGAASDQFGTSVALDGDTAVVGALGGNGNSPGSGAAYVFGRDVTGTWAQQARLIAADGEALDQFGISVALDGDTAVVGARRDDDNGVDSGSAYVFTRDAAGTWNQQEKLVASDGAPGDLFAGSVALNGDTAVVGASGNDENGLLSGATYVFARDATGTWTQQAKLIASDGAASDQFGTSVAIDGDTAVIGAFGNDDNGSDSGSAYVFTRDVTGTWDQQAMLIASDGAPTDFFGGSVALHGDTAVIGAFGDDDNGSNSGSAYVFTRGGLGAWTESLKLLASDGQANDLLGRFSDAIDTSGGLVVAGAPFHDYPDETNAGAAYVYSLTTDDEGPVTSNLLIAPNPVLADTPFTVSARVDDTDTGGSSIAGASYAVNGGAGSAMSASDGAFDEVAEDVTALNSGLAADLYKVCVSGTDSAGNTGGKACTFLAVYDPSAGFPTGGGWFDSPPGAQVADAGLSGKASFGFVSKYRKDQKLPEGSTEFHTGNLNFRSTGYEWLVVTGAKSIFRGSGTVNGNGNYGFQLSAVDATLAPSTDADLFRIRIWDKDNGDAVVYDNNLGAPVGANPTTAIDGGSIVIHTPIGRN